MATLEMYFLLNKIYILT